MTILLAMLTTASVSRAARNVGFRAGICAVLVLWGLASLVGGSTRALCLDLGGECSPPSAAPVEPCHDRLPDSGAIPSCGACLDILVREDATARRESPDLERDAAGSVQPIPLEAAAAALDSALVLIASPLIEIPPQHPLLRSVVLRI